MSHPALLHAEAAGKVDGGPVGIDGLEVADADEGRLVLHSADRSLPCQFHIFFCEVLMSIKHVYTSFLFCVYHLLHSVHCPEGDFIVVGQIDSLGQMEGIHFSCLLGCV